MSMSFVPLPLVLGFMAANYLSVYTGMVHWRGTSEG